MVGAQNAIDGAGGSKQAGCQAETAARHDRDRQRCLLHDLAAGIGLHTPMGKGDQRRLAQRHSGRSDHRPGNHCHIAGGGQIVNQRSVYRKSGGQPNGSAAAIVNKSAGKANGIRNHEALPGGNDAVLRPGRRENRQAGEDQGGAVNRDGHPADAVGSDAHRQAGIQIQRQLGEDHRNGIRGIGRQILGPHQPGTSRAGGAEGQFGAPGDQNQVSGQLDLRRAAAVTALAHRIDHTEADRKFLPLGIGPSAAGAGGQPQGPGLLHNHILIIINRLPDLHLGAGREGQGLTDHRPVGAGLGDGAGHIVKQIMEDRSRGDGIAGGRRQRITGGIIDQVKHQAGHRILAAVLQREVHLERLVIVNPLLKRVGHIHQLQAADKQAGRYNHIDRVIGRRLIIAAVGGGIIIVDHRPRRHRPGADVGRDDEIAADLHALSAGQKLRQFRRLAGLGPERADITAAGIAEAVAHAVDRGGRAAGIAQGIVYRHPALAGHHIQRQHIHRFQDHVGRSNGRYQRRIGKRGIGNIAVGLGAYETEIGIKLTDLKAGIQGYRLKDNFAGIGNRTGSPIEGEIPTHKCLVKQRLGIGEADIGASRCDHQSVAAAVDKAGPELHVLSRNHRIRGQAAGHVFQLHPGADAEVAGLGAGHDQAAFK